MSPLERLERAWINAGYPIAYMPKQQFANVAPYVAEAFAAGETDFFKSGWNLAKVDYPFAPSHPRYLAMLKAYRELDGQGQS